MDKDDLNVKKEAMKVDEERAADLENNEDIFTPNIPESEWMKEAEKVSSFLRPNVGGDNKEWRAHLEQAKKYVEKS